MTTFRVAFNSILQLLKTMLAENIIYSSLISVVILKPLRLLPHLCSFIKFIPIYRMMIKNVKKKGRELHLPDSHLLTSLERREPGEKMKYKELSVNTVAFISCRHSLHLQLMKATVNLI